MITENEIREILKKRYGCETGNLKLDFEELKKILKCSINTWLGTKM